MANSDELPDLESVSAARLTSSVLDLQTIVLYVCTDFARLWNMWDLGVHAARAWTARRYVASVMVARR